MSIQVFGIAVSRGIAIGRAVLVASSRVDVAHYFVSPGQVEAEIERLRDARDEVAGELETLKADLPAEAPMMASRAGRVQPSRTSASQQSIRSRQVLFP